MRTGSPVIVQRGNFVISGDGDPLQNFILAAFPMSCLPANQKISRTSTSVLARNGISFLEPAKSLSVIRRNDHRLLSCPACQLGAGQSSDRNVVDRNERDVIYGVRCVLATEADAKNKGEYRATGL